MTLETVANPTFKPPPTPPLATQPDNMPRFFKVLLAATAGYVVAASGGCAAVELMSTANIQDRALEESVMSLLVFGPAGFIIAGTWAFFRH